MSWLVERLNQAMEEAAAAASREPRFSPIAPLNVAIGRYAAPVRGEGWAVSPLGSVRWKCRCDGCGTWLFVESRPERGQVTECVDCWEARGREEARLFGAWS